MSTTVVYGLLLQAKGEIKKIKLCDTKNAKLTSDSLQTIVKKKTPLSEVGQYSFGELKLTLFGYTAGKAGTENKHELPPPNDNLLCFSDILLIAAKASASWEHPVNFTPEQYEKFYSKAFGGFEDIGSEDSETDDDDEDVDKEDEEEEEEVVVTSKKKKAAEEDGVPEDEEDKEEDTEEDDNDEEEDDVQDDVQEDEDGGVEEDEEGPRPKARASAKKKPAKPNTTVIQNTGRAKQQLLMMRIGFEEMEVATSIPKDVCKERDIRMHTLHQIDALLGNHFKEDEKERLEKAILESAMHDATTKHVLKHFDNNLFQICYTSSARRLLSNLSETSYVGNKHLLHKLMKGDLNIEHLSKMSVMDYEPTLYTDLRERQQLREQRQLEGNRSMASDMFECYRCNKRETIFYELQTRSADEPMTKFITCVNCGNHWRQ
jgi:DNA-directed RNA polymerase subunit M/transcription elongation factor TFIIS